MEEQGSPYRSLPGTPTSSGGGKKRKGIKKIISGFTKKNDPTPEAEGKGFEPATNENGERVHIRSKISSFFKHGPKVDGEGSPSPPVHPLKELLDQEFKDEAGKEETKPDDHTNKHNLVKKAEEVIDSLIHRKRDEAEKEETKLGIYKQSNVEDDGMNKHNLVKKAEEAIDSLIHRKRYVDAPAITEYSKLEKSSPSQEPKPAERAEEDQNRHDHDNKINTGSEAVAAEEVEADPTPTTSPPPLPQENENFGCETLAKGVQKICLPWTLNKDRD